jgi:NTE family protein
MPTIGLALGGGGAKGLAHVAVLQAIDELGLQVSTISGTSIGAILGSVYAAGRTATEIRDTLDELFREPDSLKELLNSERMFGWLDLLSVELGRSHLLQADAFVAELIDFINFDNLEDLNIPLKVVAADFWAREQVVLERGPIAPAVQASFCLPGVFKPVVVDNRVLVDGGCVNPVPFDLIREDCDVVIAVDVLGRRYPDEDLMPSYTEALFNTFQIAEATIARQKMTTHPPDIYLEPAITNVKVLEFQKAQQVYDQTASEVERMKQELDRLLG